MLEQQIYNLTEKRICQLGYELIQVKYFDNTKTLQIMIDSIDEKNRIGIEDCTKVSQEVSILLDVEDLIHKRYNLEVTSPGLDRPLLKMADFKKYKGFKAKLLLKNMMQGMKKCKGIIMDVDQTNILFKLQNLQEIEIPFTYIETANLIINEGIFQKK